jgi:hypothetical protein
MIIDNGAMIGPALGVSVTICDALLNCRPVRPSDISK